MRAEISDSAKGSEDSADENLPIMRQKPPRARKKNKDPLFEEDVLDGFAFLSFTSYEDLEVSESGRLERRSLMASGRRGPRGTLGPRGAGGLHGARHASSRAQQCLLHHSGHTD